MASSSRVLGITGSFPPPTKKVKPTMENGSRSLDDAKAVVQILLKATHEDVLLKGIQTMREQIKSGGSDQFYVLTKAGVIPPLIRLLESSSSRVQVNVSAALMEILGEELRVHRTAIYNANAVPQLIKLIETTENPTIANNCIGCLTRITFDLGKRKLVLEKGVVPSLIKWTNYWLQISQENVDISRPNPKKTSVREIVRLYYHLCEIKNPQREDLAALAQFLPAYIRIISGIQDHITLESACDAIARFTCTDPDNITAAVAKVCRPITELLLHPKVSVAKSALTAIFNISAGSLENVDEIVKCGALPKLAQLLADPPKDEEHLATIYSIIRNVCFEGSVQIQQVMGAHLVPALVQVAKKGQPKAMLEAVYALYNVCKEGQGTMQQVEFLVEHGALEALCKQFYVMNEEILRKKLDVLTYILGRVHDQREKLRLWKKRIEKCEGLQNILCLCNPTIYKAALNLKEKFFGGQDG